MEQTGLQKRHSRWQCKELGRLCEIQVGATPFRNNPRYWDGDHTWLRIGDMTEHVVSSSTERITDMAVEDHRIPLVKKGTLLMSFRLTVGKLAFAGKDLYTNEGIAALIIKKQYKDKLLPEFLYWALQSISLGQYGSSGIKGSSLNRASLKSIPIPTPPIAEQQHLVALMNKAREIQRLSDVLTTDVGKLMDAIRSEAFYQGEQLPTDWELCSLETVAEINPKRRPSIERDDDTLTSFVPMAAVDEIRGDFARIEEKPYREVRRGFTYFEENDVVFAKITPSTQNGKSAVARNLIDGFGFGTTEFHVLRSNGNVLPDWIHQFVRQSHFLLEATQHFRGAVGQQRVPPEFLASYQIPVPFPNNPSESLAVQAQIVERIKRREGMVRQMIEDIAMTKVFIEQLSRHRFSSCD